MNNKFILGKKIGISRIYDKNGQFFAVTLIDAGPCFVTQIKKEDKDKYNSIQIGFKKKKNLKKAQQGHLKKSGIMAKYLKEFRINNIEEIPKIGEEININIFKVGERINISGISKGKGFQGVIKRHGFKSGPKAHGSDHHREPGSIGSAYPQSVKKGRKLPGRTGAEKVTVKNLKIIKIIPEKNILMVNGSVPGANNNLLSIKI